MTRRQLLAVGLNDDGISYRVNLGLLYRVHRGVYGVGHPPQTPLELASAAVLACGPGAALSHLSALALWGFAGKLQAPFDVAVQADRRPKGIRVHRAMRLHRQDIKVQLGIRTTSPARTILDCAPQLTDKARTRAVNDALRSYLTRGALEDIIARNPGHPGTKLLIPFVTRTDGPTRSEFEDDFPGFCRAFDLPVPQLNVIVGGVEVDAYFPEHNLIVELDGWRFHNTRESFESDRARDANALANGTPTVRITRDRMTADPPREAELLRKILSRASAPPEPSEAPTTSPRGSRASRAALPAPHPTTRRPVR